MTNNLELKELKHLSEEATRLLKDKLWDEHKSQEKDNHKILDTDDWCDVQRKTLGMEVMKKYLLYDYIKKLPKERKKIDKESDEDSKKKTWKEKKEGTEISYFNQEGKQINVFKEKKKPRKPKQL